MSNPTLADLCTLIADSEHKTAPKHLKGQHPLVRTTDLGNARVDFARAQRVNAATYAKWTRRGEPRTGDLILAREAPVGGVARVPKGVHPVLGQRTVLLRPASDVNSRFLMYRLAAADLQARMNEMATGSTVPHLNMSDIRAFEIPDLPALPEQECRAAVLAAFDEIIAINERRIELLEDLVRSLYREWFVRFRFLGHMSTIDGLPDGWQRRPASQVFTVNPRIQSDQTTFSKVTMGDVDERFAIVFPSEVVARASGSKFQRDDVLFARITPCLENGKTALAKFLERGVIGVGSTEFIVLRGVTVGPTFTYCAARSDAVRQHAIKSMSGASGRQRVASNAFDGLELVEPSAEVAVAFERCAGPLLDEGFALAL